MRRIPHDGGEALCQDGFTYSIKKLQPREIVHPSPRHVPKENHWSKTHDKFPVPSALPVGWKASKISISAVRTFTRSNHTLSDIFLLG